MLRFLQRTTLRAALALLAITNLLDAPPARSQRLGDVALSTTTQVLANAVACTGSAQNFFPANLGQSFHLATAAILSGAASFGMEIDGVDAVSNVFKLSNPMITVGTTSFLVQGSGYMPIIRVTLTCTIGSTFSLSYSGSFAQTTINPGTPGTGGSAVATIGGNVQGIVAAGVNGAPIFPLIGGGVRPALNAQTVQFGVDTFSVPPAQFIMGNGVSGAFTLRPPIPSAPGEWGLAILANTQNAVADTLLGPWSCIGGGSCNASTNPAFAQLNLGVNNNLAYTFTNSSAATTVWSEFLLFSNIPTVRQQTTGNQLVSNGTVNTGVNTLAGSTSIFVVTCSTLNCSLLPTDSQGNTVRQIGRTIQIAANSTQGMNVYIVGPTSAAADTLTFNAQPGTTVNGSGFLELTGLLPGNLATLSAPLSVSNNTVTPQEDDNGGLFVEAGGYDYTQTLTFSAAGTVTVGLWAESQHGLFSSCVLSERITNIAGAATTLNTYLQDSADFIGFNDRLSMTQGTTAAGAQNLFGAVPAFNATALTAAANSAVVTTDGALAAGSGIAGPLGPFGRIKFVTTGAAVAVTVTFNVACR